MCPPATASHLIFDHLTPHLRVHLRGEHLGELGDEVVHQLVAFLGDDVDGDQVTGALQYLLQLLLSRTEIHVSAEISTRGGADFWTLRYLSWTQVELLDTFGVVLEVHQKTSHDKGLLGSDVLCCDH